MIAEEPDPAASETALLGTGWPYASTSVTVIVEVVELSATTEDGLAATVEAPAETAPTVKLTVGVWEGLTESVVSCAV